jgi:DNA-binding SARP family transcriptional activator/WD40 repeat protein
MQVRVLGPVEAENGQGPIDLGPRKQRALLTLLAINVNTVVSTDRILEALWGEAALDKEDALWVLVSRLRTALEPDRPRGGEGTLIATEEPGYILRLDAGAVDLERFGLLVTQARSIVESQPSRVADLCADALGLWRGEAGGEFAHEEFVQRTAGQATEMRLEAHELLAGARLQAGAARQQIAELTALHEDHPLRDRLVELLAMSLYQSGQQADALRLVDRHRGRLGDELGLDLPPSLRSLEEQILLHDPTIAGPVPQGEPSIPVASAVVTGANPFKGLQAFGESDADLFFGRGALVDEIAARLETTSFVAVVGASGSGKSSMVRAGLVPRLRRATIGGADVVIAQMMPGANPVAELEAALCRVIEDPLGRIGEELRWGEDGLLSLARRSLPEGAALVLLVDQFEELFTLVEDHAQRERFIGLLVSAAADVRGRVKVVLTLRADFYDRPLAHPDLGPLVSEGLVSITAMTAAELEEAAVQPAAAAGTTFAPSLLVTLVAEIKDHPAALPLFQFTLRELFDQATNGVMTTTSYDQLGGVSGALQRRAEDVFQSLAEDERIAARQLFLRLVTITDAATARRRVEASELLALDLDPVSLQVVIEAFGRERLLSFDVDPVTGRATLEVAHEALVDTWPRVAQWIDQRRDVLSELASLRAATADWARAGRHPDYVLTGERLAVFEAWPTTGDLALTSEERALLEASIDRREQSASAEAERQGRELTRLRRLLAVTGACLVLAVLAGAFAVVQQRRANSRADEATAAAALADARGLAARATSLASRNPLLALAVAAESTALVNPSPVETLEALAAARGRAGSGVWIPVEPSPNPKKSTIHVMALSPDGTTLGVGGSNVAFDAPPGLDFFDTTDGRPVGASIPAGMSSTAIAFSDDGSLLATATVRDVRLFDAVTHELVAVLPVDPDAQVAALDFSPDGTRLAGGDGSRLVQWDTQTYEVVDDVLVAGGEPIRAIAYSPTGEWVAVAGGNRDRGGQGPTGFLVVAHVDGEVRFRQPLAGLGRGVAWTPDASTLVAAVGRFFLPGRVLLFDASDGNPLPDLVDNVITDVSTVEVSPDGATAVAGGDRTAVAWSLRTGARLDDSLVLSESSGINDWDFGFVDGRIIAAGWGFADSLQLWTRSVVPDYGIRAESTAGAVAGLAFAGDPDVIGVAGRDGTFRLVDGRDGRSLRTMDAGMGRIADLAGNAQRGFALLGQDGEIAVVDIDGSTQARVATGGPGRAIEFSADGSTIVVAVGFEVQFRDAMDLTLLRTTPVGGSEVDHVESRTDESGSPVPIDLPGATGSETITDLAVSPAGDRVVVTTVTGAVAVLSFRDPSEIRVFPAAHVRSSVGVVFKVDGGGFYTLGSAGDLLEWDAISFERRTLDVGDFAAEAFAIGVGGRILVIGGEGGVVNLTEPSQGRRLGTFAGGHNATVVEAAMAPDSRHFVTGARDGTLLIWDVLDASRACELARSMISTEEVRSALDGRDPVRCVD